MTMSHYPIMLNGSAVLAVVVGGGHVGRRKCEPLLASGARVRVVDPAGGDWPSAVEVIAEPYEGRHLVGANLVFACTDDRSTNARIAADASAAGALVNVADDPQGCDFTVPAVHRSGGITIAVSTAGGVPGAAAVLRDMLAGALPAEADEFALAAGELRDQIKVSVTDGDRRRRLLCRLTGPEGLAAFAHGGRTALKELLDEDRQ